MDEGQNGREYSPEELAWMEENGYAVSYDEYQAAKQELGKAIRDFYAKTEPEVFITTWLAVTHKDSIELSQQGTTSVGVLVESEQPFVMSRGLLEIAVDNWRQVRKD